MKYLNKFTLAFSVILLSSLQSAHAALPTGVATFFNTLTADFNDLIDTYAYPLLLVILGAYIIIGLIKKFSKRVSN